MKRNEIISEIKANPDYLRAAERSRKDAQDTQRQYWKSPEEKAAARRKEIKRDKGIAGYSKRHRKEHPEMYPKIKPRDDMKGPSGPQDWYGQNRYMGDSVEQGVAEGFRLIGTKDAGNRTVKFFRDTEWNEYIVRFYTDGEYREEEDYHTDDKQDAMDTAKSWLKGFPKNDTPESVTEGDDDNFTIDDIKRLEKIGDLSTMKELAKELIKGKPVRRMKPEKINYFYDKVDSLNSPLKVIKLMYDLLLAGEGHRVVGSRNSMNPNSYRRQFGENAGTLKVAKDDEQQTVLQNPTTGVQTQIDKKNPNAPRLTQDEQGKLKLAMPQGAQTGGNTDQKQPLVGKDVQVDQMPETVDIKRLAGLK